jgi:hypothetical protein
MKQHILILIIAILFNATALAQEYIWLIGGGPQLNNSQAQIELNTKWVQKLINKYKKNATIKVYYTDGFDPSSDVLVQQNTALESDDFQPLARVFGVQSADSIRYYSHTIDNIQGSTEVDFLRKELLTDFKKLKENDQVLLIFQGHGGIDRYNTANNTLKLWNNTSLSVIELEQMLQQLKPNISVRYIFPQCFSGAFSRLIYPEANDKLEPVKSIRCGFMAEYDYEQSEGCTSSINEQDYRDYTTYFFAALDGKSRQQQSLTANPDRDNNGVVSLREAHFYSLSQAISADIPRSTSETYLEKWAPWYLRWMGKPGIADNIYSQLAREVANNNHLTLHSNGQIVDIKNKVQKLGNEIELLKEAVDNVDKMAATLQKNISVQLVKKWPYILSPHTQKYYQLLKKELDNIQHFIINHKDYVKLVEVQDKKPQLDKQLLELKRKITQFQKINRLNMLSRIYERFNHHASDEQKQAYNKILSCESMSF